MVRAVDANTKPYLPFRASFALRGSPCCQVADAALYCQGVGSVRVLLSKARLLNPTGCLTHPKAVLAGCGRFKTDPVCGGVTPFVGRQYIILTADRGQTGRPGGGLACGATKVCLFFNLLHSLRSLRGLKALPLLQPAKAGTSATGKAGTSATTDGSP